MTDLPLAGKRVVNTRAIIQAEGLNRLLAHAGALPIPYPCLAFAPPLDLTPLDDGLRRLACGGFDWLVLTSSNAVRAVGARIRELGLETAAVGALRLAAVGPTTAEACRRELFASPVVLPEQHTSSSIGAMLAATGRRGDRVFLPQSDLARDTLAGQLREAGFRLDAVVAYRTVQGSGGAPLVRLLRARQVDAITFTSPSTVNNFCSRLTDEGGDLKTAADVCVACIGPPTAAAAAAANLPPRLVSADQSVEGMVSSLMDYFAEVSESG